jgi:hypothetical protein
MKKILLLLGTTCGLLSSCNTSQPLMTTASQNNNTYHVSYLFEHEGCKVYRFIDQGNWVYYTNCNGQSSTMKADTTKVKFIMGEKEN